MKHVPWIEQVNDMVKAHRDYCESNGVVDDYDHLPSENIDDAYFVGMQEPTHDELQEMGYICLDDYLSDLYFWCEPVKECILDVGYEPVHYPAGVVFLSSYCEEQEHYLEGLDTLSERNKEIVAEECGVTINGCWFYTDYRYLVTIRLDKEEVMAFNERQLQIMEDSRND